MDTTTPLVESLFEPLSGTYTHVVYDRPGGHAAVIDPVLDFDACRGRTSHVSADAVIAAVRRLDLNVDWILETHAHADHLSAAPYLQSRLGGQTAIGAHIRTVQATFKRLFHLEDAFATDGSQFDRLLQEGDTLALGGLTLVAWHVPGHTPADMAYRVGDAVFVGDTLFQPDVGTARCDFPGGDARTLYRSIRRLLALPPATRLFMCHDYPPAGREPSPSCSVAEERAHNIHVHDGVDEARFVALREARDAALALPQLMIPSIQVNVRAGQFPPPEANGVRYLKLPIDAL
jgi:glyoxylase-like metal-dependent hydrolase (beta-lactamase superfamily II)